jgi:hypothetical protein
MQNLIIVDRASAKSYIIEIGNQGYEVFVAEKISSDIPPNTIRCAEPVKASDEPIPETPKEIKKQHIRRRKRLQRKLLRAKIIEQIKEFVAQHDGETPYAKDMAVKHGRVPYNTVVKIFGSFNNAVEEAGFTPRNGQHKKGAI